MDYTYQNNRALYMRAAAKEAPLDKLQIGQMLTASELPLPAPDLLHEKNHKLLFIRAKSMRNVLPCSSSRSSCSSEASLILISSGNSTPASSSGCSAASPSSATAGAL